MLIKYSIIRVQAENNQTKKGEPVAFEPALKQETLTGNVS